MSSVSHRLLLALRLLALVLIALHLLAPLSTEQAAWGLWPITYLPPSAAWGLALASALAIAFGDRLPLGRLPRVRWSRPWLPVALALLSGVGFYLLRIRHLRWGDAKVLVKALADPYWLTYVWQAPLDVFLHAKAWALGNRLFGWPDPIPAYWIISTAAGILFVWVLLGLSRWLGRNRTERGLIFGSLATLGTVQLFFGYIENYTLMTVGVLIYAWLALRALRGELSLVWPATALAITHALHPSTIILAPSLLYLGWQISGDAARVHCPPDPGAAVRQARWRALLCIAVPYTLIFAGVVALMSSGQHGVNALLGDDFPGGGDRRWFVPLFTITSRFERYTMFSLGHLSDVVNEQLLVAPVIWPAFALAACLAWGRLPRHDPVFRLLLVMAVSYLLLTLTWNPDYGGQRDWDLFAPAALPAALLLSYTLPRVLPEGRALRAAGLALVAAQAFHTIAWIYQNTLPWPTG